CQQYYSTPHSV
nr:immunoglobulin light chain junction region [Macaca mulatta]